jgi:mRNA-degrading endonuclease toxin of MazEF toxin-antitoxin module
VLVLGRDELLPSLSQIPVVPLSTQIRGLPWEVQLAEGDGLPGACVVKVEWIRIVDRAHLGPWIASLRKERWPQVRSSLLHVLGFE